MFPAASGPYAEPGILRVPQRNFCRATRRMPGSVGLHQWEPDPHGRRRAEQDQVPAGLGQCGPDESQMPQVRPGLLPLLRGHIGPRGDAGESRAGEQAGRPGHDWIGGERQWQRWGRAGCVGGVGSFERGGAHAHQSGAIGGRRWSTSLALWRGHAQGDLWHPANRCVWGLSARMEALSCSWGHPTRTGAGILSPTASNVPGCERRCVGGLWARRPQPPRAAETTCLASSWTCARWSAPLKDSA